MNLCLCFFFLFIMGAVDPCNAQTAVFRYAANPSDPLNRVAISRYGTPGSQPIASLPVPSGVTLITDPAAVQNANGIVFVAVLDSMARLWTILFNGVSGAWGNWIFMGGVVNHRIPPAIALKSDNLAYIVAIDFGGSLWVNTIDSSGIPGQYIGIGGILGAYPARPAAALTSDGILHIFLRDGFYADVDAGSFWVARYNTNTGTTAWVGPLGTGIGTLSAVAAPDGAAYAALRDASYGLWLLRENGALAFYSSGGWVTTEPSAALVTDSLNVSRVYVAGGASTAFYRRWSLNSGTWDGDWVNTGLPAAQVGLATVDHHAYMVAQTPAGQISWNPIDMGGSSWTAYQGTAAGAIASTPRDRVYPQTPPVAPTIYPDNVDVTWQPQSNGYLMSATVAVASGSDAHNVSEVRLHFENANGKDFGCNLMARPNTGVMYLADDVGEWGPNERDRYTAGRNIKPGDPNTLPDWPNNSQCTLYAEGSSFQYFQNNQRVTVNFHVAFKSNIKGYFNVSMFSRMNTIFGVEQSALEDMGTYLAGTRTLSATVLPTGFKNASSTFKVLSQSGNRELFFFRFDDPHGAQQLETTQIDFSPGSASPGLPTSSGCRVMVSPMADLIWLVGGFPSSAFAGTPGTLQNGQCTVYAASSKVQYLSPTEVLVRLDVGFGGNFAGPKYLHRSVNGFNWFNDDSAHYDVTFGSGAFSGVDAFRSCAESPTNPGPCRLSDGIHLVTQAIFIKGSNKVIQGQSKYGTVLKRGPGFSVPMISVGSDGTKYSGIVIKDLTIDGGRTGTNSTGVQDLSILNVDGDTTIAGGFGLKVENCRFLDSGHSAIAMHPGYPGGPSSTKGIIIQNNEFRRSIRAAIHVSLGGTWWPTAPTPSNPAYYYCDASFPPEAPTDVLVQNNFFEENDTGAFGIDVSNGVKITENAMLDNYNNGLDCGGGVVALGSCATYTAATGNFIWNKGVYKNPAGCVGSQINEDPRDQMAIAPAFEIWGRNITVSNNWMEYFSNEGMYLAAVAHVTVQQNKIRNASRMYHYDPGGKADDDAPGIQVANCYQDDRKRGCGAHGCVVDDVTITNNQITNFGTLNQSYGIRFRNAVCGETGANESMTSVTVLGNYGVNRQGAACRWTSLTFYDSNLQPAIDGCPQSVSIGNPSNCGTSGCQ